MKPIESKSQSEKGRPPSKRPRRPAPPKAPTWDQKKALTLAQKGVGPSDISAMVGVSRGTVRQYLKRVAPELAALQTFKDHLGDSLALTLAKCSDLEDKLLDALNDQNVLASLTTTEKERLLGRVTITKGVTYDKWRLQEGKSTHNSSHQIQLTQVHDAIDFHAVSRSITQKDM